MLCQNTIKELFDEPSGLGSLVSTAEARDKELARAGERRAAAAAAAAAAAGAGGEAGHAVKDDAAVKDLAVENSAVQPEGGDTARVTAKPEGGDTAVVTAKPEGGDTAVVTAKSGGGDGAVLTASKDTTPPPPPPQKKGQKDDTNMTSEQLEQVRSPLPYALEQFATGI